MNISIPPSTPFLGQFPINVPASSSMNNTIVIVLAVAGALAVGLIIGMAVSNHIARQKQPWQKQAEG